MNHSASSGPTSHAPQPAPGSEDKLGRLRALLREMFQLDRGDLDFGLYRIMNRKAAEITAFLDRDLLPQVQDALKGTSAEHRERVDRDLQETLSTLNDLGVRDPEQADKVKDLRRQRDDARADAQIEADVYGHLAEFFTRYYADGDFMSQRRYSSGGGSVYLVPYDGEEVKLHWANADQYYVKTTENYAAYTFTVEAGSGRRVRFEIAAAEQEKDGVKAPAGRPRRFLLAARAPLTVKDDNLIVRFEHRPLTDGEKKQFPGNGAGQQGRINAAVEERILGQSGLTPEWRARLSAPASTEANGERTVLGKHLERYTARNTFDYFVHKDLGEFLRRELDLYLKSDVLNLDDLALGDEARLRRALARVRAIRHMANKIIAFLAQLEDFQKRLWLKKKLVMEAQYCVTLDRVPVALYPEIATNEAQHKEWVELLAIDEVGGDLANGDTGYRDPLSVGFLKENPYLVLDTRHFDTSFTDRLLAALSDSGPLDDQMDGLLVHGENFQALNLLTARYRGQVQCVYIDPPYNTGDSAILYKNGYPRSSWLALMANRLGMIPNLLAPDPVLYIAIDDFEMANLAKLVDLEFPWLRREMIVVNHHPQGGKATTLAHTHEYMLTCVPILSDRTLTGRTSADDVEHRPFMRSGTAESNFRLGRPNSFYAILIDPDSRRVIDLEPPPNGREYPKEPTSEGQIRIYPLGVQGKERVWRRSFESAKELVRRGKLHCSSGHTIYQLIEAEERTPALFSNWVDRRHNAGTYGANLLGDIFGIQNPFSYPKSIHTVEDALFAAALEDDTYVLDFFAGSGTTGHAVMNLNLEDGRRRKFVLVEVGDHFDTVLLPRLKKIVHSPDWKSGKPLSRDGRTQLFKYIRLESYDDAMDSLDLEPPPADLLTKNPTFAEDYRLRYALDTETAGSASLLGTRFTDPFAYTLSAVRNGARKELSVDLPETFNYLIGLQVDSQQKIDGVLAVCGTDAQQRRCLVLWRNLEKTDNAALEAWFNRHRTRLPESLDLVYANGDHNLNARRNPGDTWTAETTDPKFYELMFEGTDS